MGKLIVLKLDGTLDLGFRVTLEIGLESERPETEIIGSLPKAPELAKQYQNWQSTYRNLGKVTRELKVKGVKIYGSLKTLREECRRQAEQLCDRLNLWLKAESFFSIREKWLEKVNTSEEIRVLICTNNYSIWQLPWHQWDLLEHYNFAEIGLSNLEYERPPKLPSPPQRNSIKILAILGDRKGIEIEEDRRHLENLPGATTTFLVEPLRQELNDQLWEKTWDILFFAGHSKTEGETGRIYLNQIDSLTIDELKYSLKKAVLGGLQLAIFNSCDGLGLARMLETLHIPQIIVMREPVPDRVAQAFLQYFLQAFARKKTLYQAVQEARQRLQGLENEFPYASWLPVICQNPAILPLQWASSPKIIKEPQLWNFWRSLLVTSLVMTGLVMGVRSQGLLQSWELASYDQLLRQRPAELPDSRILLVGVDEADIRKYNHPLPDAILAQLIAKLEEYQPVAIGLDIFRDRPVPPGHSLLVAQFQQNRHLVTVCTLGTDANNAVAPPPQSPTEQIGFNDLENDRQDDKVRRYLLSRSANPISNFSPCNTSYSLSLQLAYQYLKAKGISVKTTESKNWQFGNVIFKRLASHSGGYQNLDARGNQGLINYRATPQIAQQVTVKEVLTGKFEPSWVKNRIVVIGVTAASVQDYHNTPYRRMRGLEVHAHLISQILSAVLDRRSLIWWLPQWGDTVWVWVWSLIGGMVVYGMRSPFVNQAQLPIYSALGLGISTLLLYSLCWFLLLGGGWFPFVPALLVLWLTAASSAIFDRHFLKLKN